MIAPQATAPRAYDLLVRAAGRKISFRQNRGIRLREDSLDWEIDGRPDTARLESITEVHLQTGGAWSNPIASCRIHFLGGAALTITDAKAFGANDEAQAGLYRSFVLDLHARLAACPKAAVRFTAGYTDIQFRLVAACALALAVMTIGIPLVALFMTGQAQLMLLMIGGAAFLWPLWRMLHDNSPGTYDPRNLPPELVP